MSFFAYILSFVWTIRTLKAVLFWIYLWQLKEYHIPRFIDHFRTHKGKAIFLNVLFAVKLGLCVLFFVPFTTFFVVYALLLLYLAESVLLVRQITKKNVRLPKFTSKVIVLTVASGIVTTAYLLAGCWYAKTDHQLAIYLLLFDIGAPFIISLIVLIFQPFFVTARNSILRKAKHKIQGMRNLTVIGITGSYGKTSTKEFLTTILSQKYRVLSTKEHQNSEIGIANCILENLTPHHQVFVVEMGSYAKGGIDLLCDIVSPQIGLVTGVNEQHVSLFGSMENLLSAEGGLELLNKLPRNGLLIVNGDNKYCVELYKKARIHKKAYTILKNNVDTEIWTEDIEIKKESLSFVAMTKEREIAHFTVKVLGKHNIQNLLGAILAAKSVGMNFEEIVSAITNIKPSQGGITLQKGIHGIEIIDSSYSSNPTGVMADIDYLRIFSQKKVVVMPCLIELGPKSSQIHQEIGKKIASVGDLAIITTKDAFEDIKKGALLQGMAEESIILSENIPEIFNKITTFCTEGDAVLLEGRVPNEVIKLLKAST